ncbi:MAG: glycosyltransferase [Cytophagales bacterium]|nr:MAG: glycosyltransferase [Cytophagales bacterium]
MISVITVTYNARHLLPETIASVQAQTGMAVEHLIIDGNSTDGTANWLREQNFPLVRWISEPDSGIYDAMNKGLDRAKGNWILFICAGDVILPGVLEKVAPLLTNDLDLLAGHSLQTGSGRFIGTFSDAILVSNLIHHQAAFYNQRVFENFRYDTQLRAMSDYELNLILFLRRSQVRIIDLDMSRCAEQGISAGMWQSLLESNRIKYRHLGFWKGTKYGLILVWKYGVIYLKSIKRKHL